MARQFGERQNADLGSDHVSPLARSEPIPGQTATGNADAVYHRVQPTKPDQSLTDCDINPRYGAPQRGHQPSLVSSNRLGYNPE
mmetsp:Transcript_8385/g.9845  ORF Transcript_8385/g.9845 Transcript_8385/m.9845 type:complete len:84 (+) Transcript_8385:103-354(+)